ncbi:hypothetical protein SAMN04487904_106116 [Actinopolyspora lacussalsi subsp. righensis]|uniref:PE family protein n=1 Tax=Actinopolyspora righensis TaxID=995060 RepID=A0A1I7A8C0_9ACTN|nr:hypothetical protein [Actinopolyspora righensis]SFT71158.1 hypothetical protein SAMN04487904_106116 [Actinopolyspora righensis]
MSQQNGFGVDHEKLREAIKELEVARDEAFDLSRQVLSSTPGELTAYDDTTQQARSVFEMRMNGSEGSLRSAAVAIQDKIQEKIDAYYAVLGEYDKADDNASVVQGNAERKS